MEFRQHYATRTCQGEAAISGFLVDYEAEVTNSPDKSLKLLPLTSKLLFVLKKYTRVSRNYKNYTRTPNLLIVTPK